MRQIVLAQQMTYVPVVVVPRIRLIDKKRIAAQFPALLPYRVGAVSVYSVPCSTDSGARYEDATHRTPKMMVELAGIFGQRQGSRYIGATEQETFFTGENSESTGMRPIGASSGRLRSAGT